MKTNFQVFRYGVIASDDQKVCTKAVLGNMPVMLEVLLNTYLKNSFGEVDQKCLSYKI